MQTLCHCTHNAEKLVHACSRYVTSGLDSCKALLSAVPVGSLMQWQESFLDQVDMSTSYPLIYTLPAPRAFTSKDPQF